MRINLLNGTCLLEDLEARIKYLIDKYYPKEYLAQGHSYIHPPTLLRNLTKYDPTPNKQFLEWIVRQYKNEKIRDDDRPKIYLALEKFQKIKNKQAYREAGHSPDISGYSPSDLYKAIESFENISNREAKTKGRAGELVLPAGAQLLYDGPLSTKGPITASQLQVVKITLPQAAEILCSGTQWCVANPETAGDYLAEGLLYLIYLDGQRRFLFHYESEQFKDTYDEEIEEVHGTTAWAQMVDAVGAATGHTLTNDPGLAFKYARDYVAVPWKAGEAAIAKDPNTALAYATEIVRGRWKPGEPAILLGWTSRYQAPYPPAARTWRGRATALTQYAEFAIKGRWPAGEVMCLLSNINPYGLAHQYTHGFRNIWVEGHLFDEIKPGAARLDSHGHAGGPTRRR